MTLKTVFFDAGRTLLTERNDRAAIYASVFARHGHPVQAGRMGQVMLEVHHDLPRRIDGAFRYTDPWFRAFVREVAQRVGFTNPTRPLEEEIFSTFSSPETFRLYDDTRATLEALRDHGIEIGLISNWGPRLRLVLAGLGLDEMLDDIVISAEVECEKPDPAIFGLSCDRFQVLPGQTLHVGDNARADHQGALSAGLGSLLLDRHGKADEGPLVIRSLAEVIGFVRDHPSSTR